MKQKRQWLVLSVVAVAMLTTSCSRESPAGNSSVYPLSVDPAKVGKYPASTKSGGGYVYDDVLEYRVWVHQGNDDFYNAFVTYEEAQQFSELTKGAEEPLVLVLQREHIDEPTLGQYAHIKSDRITEWRVEWLAGCKRGPDTIEKFLREMAKETTQLAPSSNGLNSK